MAPKHISRVPHVDVEATGHITFHNLRRDLYRETERKVRDLAASNGYSVELVGSSAGSGLALSALTVLLDAPPDLEFLAAFQALFDLGRAAEIAPGYMVFTDKINTRLEFPSPVRIPRGRSRSLPGWACPRCTLANGRYDRKCKACGKARPAGVVKRSRKA
jgi:hypothetical protein